MKHVTQIAMVVCAACLGSCYSPDDQYTTIRSIDLKLDDATNIYADSISVKAVTIQMPGLRHKDPMSVKLTTTWGFWSNGLKEKTVNTNYSMDCDCFKVQDQLRPERTVSSFAINVTGGDQTGAYYFNAKPRYPEMIQLFADSSALRNRLGGSTKVKAYLYSSKGPVSYGTVFEFYSPINTGMVPLQVILTKGNFVQSKVVLTGNISTPNISISGYVLADNVQSAVQQAQIIIKP